MINNNARQALSDLLTYHKIKTVDGYERKLLAAINSADSLNIKDVQTFKDYFKVSDVPYAVKNEYYLENKLISGEITVDDYKRILNSYQNEERIVKELTKRN